jgi:lysophospholipase L1-like esterase
VFVNGDSLAEGTRPYLPGALPGWHVEQSTAVSRHAPEGVALLRRRHVPPVIVMSLGTNDDPHTVDAFRAAIRETLRIAGKTRCVVWPNIVRPPVGGASYAGYNNVLDTENRRRRNLRVVDWARMVSRHRFWLAADGVHVNADGYKARAKSIARQVERCG